MNTNLWGPDGHPIGHAVADTVQPHNERSVAGAITMMSGSIDTYPCSHCRKSSAAFLHVMREDTGKPLERVIRDGEFSRWMFDYHNLINDKLDRQAWQAAMAPLLPNLASRCGVDAALLTAELHAAVEAAKAFRGKRISYDTYCKRVRAGGRDLLLDRLSPTRIFRFLRVCAFDMTPQRLPGFRRYIQGLAMCIRELPAVCSAFPAMPPALDALARDLAAFTTDHADFTRCLDASEPTALFHIMARAETRGVHDRPATAKDIATLFRDTQLFAAKSCIVNQTCV